MVDRELVLVMVGLLVLFPVSLLGADRSKADLEDPDEASNKFYERGYLTETEALKLQKDKENHKVEKTKIRLTPQERTRVKEEARVGVFTDTYTLYKIYRNDEDQPYRYALPIQQPGQHKFMDLMYGIDRDGTIHRIDLMVYREPYGSEIESRRFMGQFEGRSLESSEFRVNLDVIHIQGATISSKATARGARKVLTILNVKNQTDS